MAIIKKLKAKKDNNPRARIIQTAIEILVVIGIF